MLFPAVHVFAFTDEVIEIYIGNNPVDYTGFEILPDPNKPGTYALAVRPMAVSAGFRVAWARNGAILRSDDGTEIHLWADRDEYIRINPNAVTVTRPFVSSPPFIYEGRLYLNADSLAEMLGLVFIEPWYFIPMNGAIEERFARNDLLFSGGFIYGQNREPHRSMSVGPRGTGSGHGCGPFAVYNALLFLGQDPNPASIIRFLEYRNGLNLGGLAGTNPEVLTDYIRRAGLRAEITYLPTNFDEAIQAADAAILLYGRVRGGFFVHYAMVHYETGRFFVYNEFGNDTRPRAYGSVDALIIERQYKTIALITIL
jgi:hypothetical protein